VTPLERAKYDVSSLADCATDARDACENAKHVLRRGNVQEAIDALTGMLGKQISRLEDYRREAVDSLRKAV
jgi:hypothetical protein